MSTISSSAIPTSFHNRKETFPIMAWLIPLTMPCAAPTIIKHRGILESGNIPFHMNELHMHYGRKEPCPSGKNIVAYQPLTAQQI
jgi:hypothetical protein